MEATLVREARGRRDRISVGVAHVTLTPDSVDVTVSLIDRMLGFEGSFHIPLAHIVNAYVSSFEALELQYRLEGTNFGVEGSIGVFATPQGTILVDVNGDRDNLVLDLRGERFPRIAVQLPEKQDPNALAHEIMQRVPDSGPIE